MAQLAALGERHLQTEEVLDRRTAQICQILANAFRDTKARKKPYKLDDFMPKPPPKPRELSEEDQRAQLELLKTALGGVEEDGKG